MSFYLVQWGLSVVSLSVRAINNVLSLTEQYGQPGAEYGVSNEDPATLRHDDGEISQVRMMNCPLKMITTRSWPCGDVGVNSLSGNIWSTFPVPGSWAVIMTACAGGRILTVREYWREWPSLMTWYWTLWWIDEQWRCSLNLHILEWSHALQLM